MLAESDPELRAMAEEDVARLEPEIARIEDELKVLMLPKDPLDEKDVVLEIRAGTGGDEATLFAAEIFRMYTRFAETRHWKVEVTSSSESAVGGLKEVIGADQRQQSLQPAEVREPACIVCSAFPRPKQQGRVHTSAVTVAVLPEADEVEVNIEPKDIRIDTFCSSGPGGQSVNTTYSAVRITHLPTGTIVSCQDEKSQIKNRAKAMRVLRSRLYEIELEKQQETIGAERRSMVGTGDRSEKIRTYNFPQNRVTDHRIGFTLHQLDQVMEGKLEPLRRRPDQLLPDRETARAEAGAALRPSRNGRQSWTFARLSARASSSSKTPAFLRRGLPPKCCSCMRATGPVRSRMALRALRATSSASSGGSTTAATCTSACRASLRNTSPAIRNSMAATSA